MTTFFISVLVILAILAVVTILAVRVDPLLARVEEILTFLSTGFILFVMLFVCAEVVMRYAFNSPIPGHLELSELFMPVIVFLAIAYTQSHRGHVGMTLVVDNLPPKAERISDIAALAISAVTYIILTYFSAKHALRGWEYDDVTMSPPYFPTWPSAAVVPLGFFLCTLRLYLQMLYRIVPDRFPPSRTSVGGEENAEVIPTE